MKRINKLNDVAAEAAMFADLAEDAALDRQPAKTIALAISNDRAKRKAKIKAERASEEDLMLKSTMLSDLRNLERCATKYDLLMFKRAVKADDLVTAYAIVDKYDPSNKWNTN